MVILLTISIWSLLIMLEHVYSPFHNLRHMLEGMILWFDFTCLNMELVFLKNLIDE